MEKLKCTDNVEIGALVKLPKNDNFWWSGLIGMVVSKKDGWLYNRRDYSYDTTWIARKECEIFIPTRNIVILFEEARLEIL